MRKRHDELTTICGEVAIHDGVAVLARNGRSAPIVARVLGSEIKDGVQTVWLASLIHEPHEMTVGDWALSGAISTILSRPIGGGHPPESPAPATSPATTA